jgi:hypothetical protein
MRSHLLDVQSVKGLMIIAILIPTLKNELSRDQLLLQAQPHQSMIVKEGEGVLVVIMMYHRLHHHLPGSTVDQGKNIDKNINKLKAIRYYYCNSVILSFVFVLFFFFFYNVLVLPAMARDPLCI